MRIHVLQHVSFEGPAAISAWAENNSHILTYTRLWERADFVGMRELDLLVVMGGPMSANDEDKFDWLLPEKRFIEMCVRHNKAVLGVCLGAQLIANVLGSRVYRNREKEIGWWPLTFTGEQPLKSLSQAAEVFHWHGETFDLPSGAVHLASSEACENQAFLFDENILGLQYHLEVDRQAVAAMVENAAGDITAGPFVQSREAILGTEAQLQRANSALFALLDELTGA